MIEPEHTEFDRPRLDHKDDLQGGAVAWALLTAGVALVTASLWR